MPTIVLITGHFSNSEKFRRNAQFPRQRANSAARLEIPRPAENCDFLVASSLHTAFAVSAPEWSVQGQINCFSQGRSALSSSKTFVAVQQIPRMKLV